MLKALFVAAIACALAANGADAKPLHTCDMREGSKDMSWEHGQPWPCVLPRENYRVCVWKWAKAMNHGNSTLAENCGPVPSGMQKLYDQSKDLPPLDLEESLRRIDEQPH